MIITIREVCDETIGRVFVGSTKTEVSCTTNIAGDRTRALDAVVTLLREVLKTGGTQNERTRTQT